MFEWLKTWRARRKYRQTVENFAQARELREAAGSFDEAMCARYVEQLLAGDKDQNWVAYQALQSAPVELGQAPLVAALSDPRAIGAKVRGTHPMQWMFLPLVEVIHLLEKRLPLPPEAVAALTRLRDGHDAPHVCDAARRLLASVGEVDDLASIRARLAKREDVYRTLNDLRAALDRGHGTDVVLALFPDLAAMVGERANETDYLGHENAAELMLRADAARAEAVLLSPERFNASHRALFGELRTLVNTDRVVPPAALRPLLEALWARQDALAATEKGLALRLAVRTDDAECRAYIDRAMYDPDDDVRAHAVPAWAELNGMPRTVVRGGFYSYDDDQYPLVVRRWSAAHYFARFSLNDGFAQPIEDEDLRRFAVAGMRAAGADEVADLVDRAASLLLDVRASWDDPRVRALENEFGERRCALEVKLGRLAVDHKDEFLRAEAIQEQVNASRAGRR